MHGIASTHGNVHTHGNDDGARQRLSPRQRNTTHGNVCEEWQSLCRAYLARHTAKSTLPGMTLPCDLCRASTHGNAFAVPIVAFAVQLSRMAMLAFPVVSYV
jgi:hypothetical protein